MGRKPADSPRVYGPYKHGDRWRLLIKGEGRQVATEVRASEAEARAEKAVLEQELLQRAGRTVADALAEYRAYLEKKGNKVSSIKTTMTRLHYFFTDPTMPLPRLSAREGQRLYELRQDHKAADTHRNELAEAKTFLTWCVAKQFLRSNPLAPITGIGKRSRGKDQLSIDEARQLAEYSLTRARLGDVGALAVAVLVYTGLRASELTNLRVRDLDNDGWLLRVAPALGAADHLKSASARRSVVLPASLRELLQTQTKGKARDALIFGTHWRDWPREQTQRLCELAGVPRVTAHGLRGGAATLASVSTQDENAVAKSLGHASPSVTRAHYIEPHTLATLQGQRIASVLDSRPGASKASDDDTGEGHAAAASPDSVTIKLPTDEAATHD